MRCGNLSAIYEESGDLESKAEILEALIEADPRDPRIKTSLKTTRKRINNPASYAADRERELRRIKNKPSWIPQQGNLLDI